MSYFFMTFKDASKETAGLSLNLLQIAADGANKATIVTQYDNLVAAIADVTQCELMDKALVDSRVRVSNAVPAVGDRELKWLIRYQDNTTLKVYNTEVPGAARSLLPMLAGTDFVDVGATHAALQALITAWAAGVRSPIGNPTTLLSIQIVGRNL